MVPHDPRLHRSLFLLAASLFALAHGLAQAGADPEEAIARARSLLEGTVLRGGTQPGDQVRALSQVARLVRGPAVAERVLPLCEQALRSRHLTDRSAASAASECFAVCLSEASRPFVAIRDRLMEELPRAGTPACRAALLEVAERFYAFLERPGPGKAPRFAGPMIGTPQPSVHFDFSGLAIGTREGKGVGRVNPQAPLAVQPPTSIVHHSERLTLAPAFRGVGRASPARMDGPQPAVQKSDTLAFTPALRVVRVKDLTVSPPDARASSQGQGTTLATAIEVAAKTTLEAMANTALASAEQETRGGNAQAALDILAELVQGAPDSPSSAQGLARALAILTAGVAEGERANKLEAFEQWAAKHGGPRDRIQARLLVLQEHYKNGSFAQARHGLQEFLKAHGASDFGPRAKLLLGLTLWKSDDRAGATKVLQEIVHDNPAHSVAPQALFLIGYLAFAAGENDAARTAFARVVTDYPGSPFAEKAIEFIGSEMAKRAESAAGKPAQQTLPSCSCPRARGPVTIDGLLDDAAWQDAATLELASRDDARKDAPDSNIRVKLLWDDTCLYVAFDCRDDDVRSEAKDRDDPVMLWDAVRVLIAPVPGGQDATQPPKDGAYYDFGLSPHGVLCDARITYAKGTVALQDVKSAAEWNSPGVRQATRVDGTLNDNVPDKGWTAELAIPFADLGIRPAPGATWRLNVVHAAKAAQKERTLSSWSPLSGWLPQPHELGRLSFAGAEKK